MPSRIYYRNTRANSPAFNLGQPVQRLRAATQTILRLVRWLQQQKRQSPEHRQVRVQAQMHDHRVPLQV